MAILPDFAGATFEPGAPIDNRYFPLQPNSIKSSIGTDTDPDTGEVVAGRNDFWTTEAKFDVRGVATTVVRDTAYENGRIVEDTADWFAQDTDGNVWYFGEHVVNYEYDEAGHFTGTNDNGGWTANDPGSEPGWIMKGDPAFGPAYYNEFAAGVAEDESLVVGRGERVHTQFANYRDVLRTADSTGINADDFEFKSFAPGLGQVFANRLGPDGEVLETGSLYRNGVVGAVDRNDGNDRTPTLASLDEGKEVKRLVDVRDLATADFAGSGATMSVDLVSRLKHGDALGYYLADAATGRIGDAHIFGDGRHFDVKVADGKELGLFMVADADDLGIDFAKTTADGLRVENMLTGARAKLGDAMPPVILDAKGDLVPVQLLNALGADDGGNTLNPGGGTQAIGLSTDVAGASNSQLLGFERTIVTKPDYDGDFNDVLLAVGDTRLDRATLLALRAEAFDHAPAALHADVTGAGHHAADSLLGL